MEKEKIVELNDKELENVAGGSHYSADEVYRNRDAWKGRVLDYSYWKYGLMYKTVRIKIDHITKDSDGNVCVYATSCDIPADHNSSFCYLTDSINAMFCIKYTGSTCNYISEIGQ